MKKGNEVPVSPRTMNILEKMEVGDEYGLVFGRKTYVLIRLKDLE